MGVFGGVEKFVFADLMQAQSSILYLWTVADPTGVKQNYARRCRIPIDAITFDYTCMPAGTHPEAAPAEGGAYVNGMFVEGARWDAEAAQLAESHPKVRRGI